MIASFLVLFAAAGIGSASIASIAALARTRMSSGTRSPAALQTSIAPSAVESL